MSRFPRVLQAFSAFVLLAIASTAVAQIPDPVINEFVANHTSTDTNEYIEILGDASTDYSAFTVLEIEGDSTSNEGTIDEVITVGTTSGSGHWWTGYASNMIENGTVTLLLVQSFSGGLGDDLDTDDDGNLDSTPWVRIVDCVGSTDGGSGDLNYCAVVLDTSLAGSGGFQPGGASRIPDGTDTDSTADWVTNDFDGAGIPVLDPGSPVDGEALNTPNATNALVGAEPADPLINEFVTNHTASDTNEYIEVRGDPDTDYSAFTVLEIEGDSSKGTIDEVITVGTTNASGHWFTGYASNLVENGTVTLLLVETFKGALGNDLDTDDDGTFDTTPWDRIVDCVGITDDDVGDLNYCSVVLDSTLQGSSGFTPGGASRIPDGTDTDSASDWVRNDFDGEGIPALEPGTPDEGEALNTPDAVNALAQAELPKIVINEIMQNPDNSTDSNGEWIELYNAGDSAVDIDGWTILDLGADSHVIDNGGPLMIAAGDYLVLGRSADTGLNGGVIVDYVYGTAITLANGDDEVILLDGSIEPEGLVNAIDRVEYDGGPNFPDPTGASMALISPELDNNVGSNWCTSTTEILPLEEAPLGEPDFATPGEANDCGGAELPVVVINEIMQNPSAVGDDAGEWVELHNPGEEPVDIDGWIMRDDGSDSHTINNGGPLVIPAGGFLVLGNNGDSGSNGGVPVDYVYSQPFFFSNGADELILELPLPGRGDSLEIDRVEYDGGPNFPDPTGASMALINPSLDNNVGENWCESTTLYGGGDTGTPGGFNDCNGLVVINEIMQNPDVVDDLSGEWFELHNPSAVPVDIDGWTISDNDTDSYVISNGVPLVLPAGGYLVLGNNSASGSNGGVAVDYQYTGIFLGNGADELVLTPPVELRAPAGSPSWSTDFVEWDGGPNFPDPTGASMALIDPALDNNVGENWCESPTPFGDGDSGTPGAANNCGALPPPICYDDKSVTLISAVQGTTDTSPFESMVVEIEGVVVGDLQSPGEFGGLFVQEENDDADGNPLTSEGIFVFTDIAASVGDQVRARGTVLEFNGLTELSPTTDLVICDTGVAMPTPAMPTLPLSDPNEFEAIESMSIVMPQALVINDIFTVARFGEILVSSIRRSTGTSVAAPGAPANAVTAANVLDQLIIDDRRTGSNLEPLINGQDDTNPMSATNPIRNGMLVTGVTGVMHYAFDAWRVQPTTPYVIDESANPRTAAPAAVGGTLKVAGFNVLNFFTTVDTGASICGPLANQGCRGADSPEEYTRQLDKLISAIAAIDADVLGLVELENNASASLQAIVDALNATRGAGTWDYIDTGTIGGDAIKVGFIYKPDSVTPEGDFALLTSAVDPRFDDGLSRPSLAQSFRSNSNLGLFTPIVNHLKSKGCGGATGANEDQGDGQGCYNAARTSAAEALRDWANADPTGTGSEASLILGDLNSYYFEDPIQTLVAGGFTSLERLFNGPDSYSYQFMGEKGTLDYAMSSELLTPKITGAAPWHINADETVAADYNTEFNPPSMYAASPYRTADHDPVVVGMQLNPPASITIPTLAAGVDALVEVTTPLGDKCGFSSIEFVSPTGLGTPPPANLEFPFGVLQFTVETCSAGTTATVSVTLPDIPEFLAWFKHTNAGGWDIYPHTFDGGVYSFEVTDGGMGDEDGVANGIIIDPSGPAIVAGGRERATFLVTKDFDDNNPAEVGVTISCNTGLPLEQTTMIAEGGHVEFVVQSFEVGTLNCSVSEVVPNGYAPNHVALPGYLGQADQIASGETACSYTGVSNGQFLCQITNTLQEVEVTINKEWIDDNPGFNLPLWVEVQLSCSSAGWVGEKYIDPSNPGVFGIYPHYDGETCTVTETPEVGVLADLDGCGDLNIAPGQDAECTIVNTRLYEGIPTLSQYGLLILSLLMLMMGAVAVRRFT